MAKQKRLAGTLRGFRSLMDTTKGAYSASCRGREHEMD